MNFSIKTKMWIILETIRDRVTSSNFFVYVDFFKNFFGRFLPFTLCGRISRESKFWIL